jgi:hypothetical protein
MPGRSGQVISNRMTGASGIGDNPSIARVYEHITEAQRHWVARQAMFFVATAPLAGDGHINLSPKGPIGSLAILDDHTIAYLDVHGSGAETIAHLRENGRIVVMLCAFEGPPRIVRFHGRGEVVIHSTPRFEALLAQADFADASLPEARRAIIVVHVTRVSDSCGYGVPLMSFEGLRDHHALSVSKHLRTIGLDGYEQRQRDRHQMSLDGLPGAYAAD